MPEKSNQKGHEETQRTKTAARGKLRNHGEFMPQNFVRSLALVFRSDKDGQEGFSVGQRI
jgi:hypothetical protein